MCPLNISNFTLRKFEIYDLSEINSYSVNLSEKHNLLDGAAQRFVYLINVSYYIIIFALWKTIETRL